MLLLTSLILQFVATLMNLLSYQTGYNSRFHLVRLQFHRGEAAISPGWDCLTTRVGYQTQAYKNTIFSAFCTFF